jgi:hypothetical protein
VLHGLILCYGVLANRHVGTSSQCPICSLGCEDILHMLFNCPRAKQIWATLGVGDKISDILQTDRSGSVLIDQMIPHVVSGAMAEALDIYRAR